MSTRVLVDLTTYDFRRLEQRAKKQGITVPDLVEVTMRRLVGGPLFERPRRRNDYQPGGMTAAQARKQRKQLKSEIDAGHKRAALEKLATLRGNIAAARKSSKPRRAEAIELCRIGRSMAKEQAKRLRIEGRAAILEAIKQERLAAREACNQRKAKVREDVRSDVARARAELREEKAFQREIRGIEARARKQERPRTSARERRQESDDAVRSNLPADLVPLFERVKRQIKGSERESRTEAFLKYAEENEAEVIAAIQERAEREIARLQRDEAKEVRALRRRGFSAAELAAVPF